MNDVYWFQGKLIPANDFSFKMVDSLLPISLSKISEIHYCSNRATKPKEQPTFIIKNWSSTHSYFDVCILLLNRLQASQMESMLIIEENEQSLSFGLFGSANVVGKYNLPPEFEIKNSGWAASDILAGWLKKSEPEPLQINISADITLSTLIKPSHQVDSMMEAFLVAKKNPQSNAPFIFITTNTTSVSYLNLERI